MLGEQEVTVLAVKTLMLHGVTYYDVSVRFEDGAVVDARLGSESVPGDLAADQRVLASRVANMVVALRRP
jgi:leucyl aminopeptidase (aminopeptidase T)